MIGFKDYKSAKSIVIIDDKDYVEGKGSNGGCYWFKTTYNKDRKKDFWTSIEETSGEFCPYCRKFECPGSCREAEEAESERFTKRDILHILHNAKNKGLDVVFVMRDGKQVIVG